MANSFVSLTVVGNVGREPEPKLTPSGQDVCTFTVATTRVFNNAQGEKKEEVTWWKITAWGNLAKTIAQFLHKGDKVGIEGRLNPDTSGNPRVWQKQDGTFTANYEITAERVHFLGGGNRNGSANGAPAEEQGEEIPWEA